MYTKRIGTFGERIAEKYLKDKGYQILDRNYSFKIPGNPQKGEVDIVAKKEDCIVFVEVKTIFAINTKNQGSFIFRTNSFSPEDKVNASKQRKLRQTSENWLMKNRIPLNSKWQIDVIAIEIEENRKAKVSHFENAISYQ